MRRISSRCTVILVIFAVSLVFSCAKKSDESAEEGTRIAVIPKATANLFWQTVHAGALTAGKEAGVQILWSGPTVETDKERQVAIVDDFIAQRVDGIVLAPQDADAIVPAVNRVADAGIPLVIFDSGVNSEKYVSYVATDNYGGGVEAARDLAKRIGNKGKVVMIANNPGGESTNKREQGFEETIKREFPDVELAQFQYHYADREKARAIMEDFLVVYPDMKGVFCSAESSTLGALTAIRSAGLKQVPQFVGFDSAPELIEAMKDGIIKAIVHQDPFRIGHDGVKTMLSHLNGEPVDKRIQTGVFVVTSENMSEPTIANLLTPDLSILGR